MESAKGHAHPFRGILGKDSLLNSRAVIDESHQTRVQPSFCLGSLGVRSFGWWMGSKGAGAAIRHVLVTWRLLGHTKIPWWSVGIVLDDISASNQIPAGRSKVPRLRGIN